MILLPDELLLARIVKSHLYKDKRSLEKTTKRIRPKYKLARGIILEKYLFNLLTRTESACNRRLTLIIGKEDWENVTKEYPKKECSYCDITKCDILERDELLKKMRDKKNRFPYVAKLCDTKCKELENLWKKGRRYPLSKPVREIIESPLSDFVDEKLRELRLD